MKIDFEQPCGVDKDIESSKVTISKLLGQINRREWRRLREQGGLTDPEKERLERMKDRIKLSSCFDLIDLPDPVKGSLMFMAHRYRRGDYE